MYNVSEAYLVYSSKTTRISHIRGRIVKNEIIKEIVDSDIAQGSVSIDSKAVSGTQFNIGEVYIDTCKVTLGKTETKTWSNLNSGELFLEYGLELGSPDIIEWVPLGVFDILPDGAVYNKMTVEITADSKMARFDKKLAMSSTSGTSFEILSWCCLKCGVELGMSKEEVDALPNGTEELYLDANSGCETYRDVIMWVAQLNACFATINREGKLVIKRFVSEQKYVINPDTVASSKYNDSLINIKNVTMQIGENFIAYEPTVVSEYTLNLEQNPLIQGNIIPDIMQKRVNAIGADLESLTYRPNSVTFFGDACLEVGDYYRVGDSEDVYLITSMSWKFRGQSKLEGVSFASKQSKTQSSKTSNTSSGSTSASNYKILRYENSSKLDIGMLKQEIMSLLFELPAEGVATLNFTAIMNVTVKGTFVLELTYDNVPLSFSPKNNYDIGYHTFNFNFCFDPTETQMTHTLTITLNSEDGGEATIAPIELNATITGWDMNTGGDEWNGILELQEQIPRMDMKFLKSILLRDLTESVDATEGGI